MLQNTVTNATMARVMRNIESIAPELSRNFANAHYERRAKTGFEVVMPSPSLTNPDNAILENFRRISRREILNAGE